MKVISEKLEQWSKLNIEGEIETFKDEKNLWSEILSIFDWFLTTALRNVFYWLIPWKNI